MIKSFFKVTFDCGRVALVHDLDHDLALQHVRASYEGLEPKSVQPAELEDILRYTHGPRIEACTPRSILSTLDIEPREPEPPTMKLRGDADLPEPGQDVKLSGEPNVAERAQMAATIFAGYRAGGNAANAGLLAVTCAVEALAIINAMRK